MTNKKLFKLLQPKKSSSGFTLIELLTGLIMSIFVTGALGFGLYQILKTTNTESSKITARNEASRAVDFISDEIRRARSIDTSNANAPNFVTTSKTLVLALEIPEIQDNIDVDGDGDLIGSDDDDTTSERIVYYLKSSNLGNWRGPQVLYRWGPPLDANGNYTEGAWQEEALIDGIDDTQVANPCDTGAGETLTPPVAKGFYGCVSGNNTAQVFLTSGIDTTTGESTNYTVDTKAVARAKDVTQSEAEEVEIPPTNFKTLGAIYNCNPDPNGDGNTDDVSMWSMRMDFGNDPSDSDNTTSWIHEPDRQGQPIDISTDNDLTISASAVNGSDCLSRGNPNTDGTEPLSAYPEKVQHTIEFMKDASDPDYDANAWKTFNGTNNATPPYDDPDVKGDGTVMVYKNGSIIEHDFFDGYDGDGDGTPDQDSLGAFLKEKGYAEFANGTDATGGYRIKGLEDYERVIAFEVGQTDQAQPGFDVQDAVFIMSNEEFGKTY